ncbi:exported protein of unknown function [Legionella nautarum]|uniref:DrrA phosphatidylinositol 4-phosphate binding domain-containing protein n=1 Tax=Legionella nautarum TaxID=45070 RepID=A0A0W0WUM0_9GAMM|nr:hypothetical protein [Legionella nautarum]KTD36035.1 exported protein of unknown function [Legionella nautarum]
MRTIQINAPQKFNACTLISVAVIQAILVAQNQDKLVWNIRRAHTTYQTKYQTEFLNTAKDEDRQGVLEKDAWEKCFPTFFAAPHQQELTAAVTVQMVKDILNNRKSFSISGELDPVFFTANLDAIDAIEKEAGKTIVWSKIQEKELLDMLHLREEVDPSLQGHFLDVVNRLENNQGITIRLQGHTISLTKRDGVYYSYDSSTGYLSYTESIDEITEHLTGKANTQRATTAIITYFLPQKTLRNAHHATQPALNIAHEEDNTQELEIKVKGKEPAIELTREQIHELIENRKTFDETEDGLLSWQQANEALIETITQEISPEQQDTINWNVVSEESLCELLGIPVCSTSGSTREENTQFKMTNDIDTSRKTRQVSHHKKENNSQPLSAHEREIYENPEALTLRKDLSNIIIHISLSTQDYQEHKDRIIDILEKHQETIPEFRVANKTGGDQFTLYVPKIYSKSKINELCNQLTAYMAEHKIIDSGNKTNVAEWITPQINLRLLYVETEYGNDKIDATNETEERQDLARTELKAHGLFSYLSQLFRKHLAYFKQFQGLHYEFATPSISREHSYEAKPSNDMDVKYQKLRGDALKTALLCDFKDSLSEINNADELEETIKDFKEIGGEVTPEYKILAAGQDRFTRMFGIKTSSIAALEAICDDARRRVAAAEGSENITHP